MAEDKGHIKSTYPLPVYNYRITIQHAGESVVVSFAEVSGLSVEYEPVTYLHGFSFVMGAHIIPGMRKPIQLTMKRGVVKSNDFLQSWIQSVYSDPFSMSAKRDIVIDLCDEAGVAVVSWTAQGAMPVKLDAPTFDANSNDVAIETMQFVVQGVQVNYSP